MNISEVSPTSSARKSAKTEALSMATKFAENQDKMFEFLQQRHKDNIEMQQKDIDLRVRIISST